MELLADIETPSFIPINNNVSDRLTDVVESLIINQQCVGKWNIDDADAAKLFMKITRKSGMTDDEVINEYCNGEQNGSIFPVLHYYNSLHYYNIL